MKYSHIDQITENEIKKLIEEKVPESVHLEYKREIKFSNDRDKTELLADVCSFANSGGGIIIYGIEEGKDENSGLPKQITGLTINIDETIRSLGESVRKGIEPVLIGLRIDSIKIDEKIVLILFIPRSSNLPHRVKFKNKNRFYKRADANRYEIPIEELRADFLKGSELSKRISEFRSERITKILSNDTPVALQAGPKLVLHIIPVNFFDQIQAFENLNQLKTVNFQPISTVESSSFSLGNRLNFDGYAVYDLVGDKSSCSYTQVFRNAVVEAVDACTFYAPHDKILFQVYERYIVKALSLYCPSLITKFIDGPCVVFLSILGIKGYEIKLSGTTFNRINKTPIDRENLLLPDMYIEDINDFSAPEVMKPVFDMVWNACGYSGSKNYDKDR